ncbi:MAG: hypothetical protein RLZZ605_1481 [Bacteroidota bacterium]|jgi:hypothetical protein
MEPYKFSTEQAEKDGFIESIIPNTWFRKDSEHLYSATAKGFVKKSGSKENLPKDENGNILLYRKGSKL